MATGLPIVATRVHGNPELVEDGVNGSLVPRRDPQSLALAIARYLEDPHLRTAHGKRSRERAVHSFDLEWMRDVHGKLYDDLLLGRADECEASQYE